MTRNRDFKCIGRALSDAGLGENTAKAFVEAYAVNAYPSSMNDRSWCISSIKGFYLDAEAQKKILAGDIVKCDRCPAPAAYSLIGYMEAKDMAYGLPADKERWEKEGLTLNVCKIHLGDVDHRFHVKEKIDL